MHISYYIIYIYINIYLFIKAQYTTTTTTIFKVSKKNKNTNSLLRQFCGSVKFTKKKIILKFNLNLNCFQCVCIEYNYSITII